jgi:hypothetical protein
MDIILKYTLKKIQEQTAEIPFIHHGGCCHFAKLLSKELEDRNIKYKTVFFDFDNTKRVAKAVRKREKELYGVSHVVLNINNYYVDAAVTVKQPSGIYDYEKVHHSYTTHSLSHKDLKYFSTNYYWNSAFNKRKYHPILTKIIKNQFKIYDKLKNE